MRKLLKKPHFWLAIIFALLIAAGWDSSRRPPDQVTAQIYVRLVRGYQWAGRPRLQKYVRCRFRPGCSEYSIEAVQRHGILEGLRLSVVRVCRCVNSLPPGTRDPVPEAR